MVHEEDLPFVLQSHFYRIRCERPSVLDPYLLLAVLCRETTRDQVRTRVVVQSTLGTVAGRLEEVVLAIPDDPGRRKEVAEAMRKAVAGRRRLLAQIEGDATPSDAGSGQRVAGNEFSYPVSEGDTAEEMAAESASPYRVRSGRARKG